MSIEKSACPHYKSIKLAAPRAEKCETCGVEAPLRVCLECGHVGCCESSGAHALTVVGTSDHSPAADSRCVVHVVLRVQRIPAVMSTRTREAWIESGAEGVGEQFLAWEIAQDDGVGALPLASA